MGKGSEGQKGKGDRGGKGGKGTNGLKNIPDEDCAKGCQRDCWNQDYAFENSRHCFVLVASVRRSVGWSVGWSVGQSVKSSISGDAALSVSSILTLDIRCYSFLLHI